MPSPLPKLGQVLNVLDTKLFAGASEGVASPKVSVYATGGQCLRDPILMGGLRGLPPRRGLPRRGNGIHSACGLQ